VALDRVLALPGLRAHVADALRAAAQHC